MTCITFFRRIIGPIGGAWIPYTAAQVAARRAARMVVAITVCTSVPVPAGAPLPPLPHVPTWQPVLLAPRVYVPFPVHQVPEPASALVLAVAVAGLAWRRWR